MPVQIGEALKALGVELTHINHTNLPDGCQDVIWMPYAAKNGFVAVTADSRILSRPAERECRRAHGLSTVFFTKIQTFKLWDQAYQIVKAWPEVEKWSRKANVGDCCKVGSNLKAEPIPTP
jgi:hypothetical protein